MQVAVRICMDAAQGLHAAHEVRAEDGTVLRLVHRDVSPQNILIGFDGTVRVTDFGIAKALGNTSRTSAGVLKGNMGYLAPEQLRFEEPDRRSDFFSLGVTLYELLSGLRLYPNKTGFDGTRRILTEPPPDIGEVRSDVPPELCELLFEMLAKDRESRPATAVEIASRLEMILALLIAEEGSVTVGDYMTQHFEANRQEQRAVLAAHLKRIESDPGPALRSVPVSEPSRPIVGASRPAESGSRGRTARRLLVGLVVGSAVAAGVVLGLRGPAQGPATTVSVRSTMAAPPALPPTPPAVETAPSAAGLGSARTATAPPPKSLAPTPISRSALQAKRTTESRDRRKAVKRTTRRVRTVDGGKSPADAKSPSEPNRLAVPLFERWQ